MKFVHVRNRNEVGEPLAHGGVTIGFEIDVPGQLFYSIAKCSRRDNYNKAVGRSICEGRFDSGKCQMLNYPEKDSPVLALLEHLKLDSRPI